jgi:hypothetical protein
MERDVEKKNQMMMEMKKEEEGVVRGIIFLHGGVETIYFS